MTASAAEPAPSMPAVPPDAPVHRLEVRTRNGQDDPQGTSVRREAAGLGITPESVRVSAVYLLEGALSAADLERIGREVLASPITEEFVLGTSAPPPAARVIEVHPLPGVMDPAAESVRLAVQDLLGKPVRVVTGRRYEMTGVSDEEARRLGERLLANPVVHRVTQGAYHPSAFPRGRLHDATVRSVPLTSLDDESLARLSREAHLFLSTDEMRAIREHYRALGREPREIELETIAQTWSEHCVHKTLKSRIRYREQGPRTDATPRLFDTPRPGVSANPDGSWTIQNLLKSTVAAATFELIADGVDWTLSVFTDNSGVIALDDRHGVCIKVETHNHPSAIEPYGGAATGIGGCIRDIIGTGLGARPIASTDVFCVAPPDLDRPHSTASGSQTPTPLPPGTLHPRRVLTQVVAGVRDYGNRMGIPTVNGAVAFDERYIGNPLVFAGCIGLIPRHLISGTARPGDRIIALGGRTGRDGIHGATFSSAELEHTAADEFAHAVQIGNPITQKQLLDAVMRARDEDPRGPLYSAITDCGAGGFSSAVGEMGAAIGAEVHLERAPLKYEGLSPTEIWISEAQERMVLAVPSEHVEHLRAICREESVEMADLGSFGTPERELVLRYQGAEVGRLSMSFLHDGLPTPTREAVWNAPSTPPPGTSRLPHIKDALLELLAHPDIASKHWIVRQYDHEVRGNTVIKPLVGPLGHGPGDASVLEPIPGSGRGIAIACGLQNGLGDPAVGGDPYLMALAAIDECVRNLVCVGADPERTAILDNFCWPGCQRPENLGTLVRAAVGCYDGAKAYRTPFVSGKDSLNNQFRYTDPATGREVVIEIPPTLLITGLAIVPRIDRCVTMEAKRAGHRLLLIGSTHARMGGSRFRRLSAVGDPSLPVVDLRQGPAAARLVAGLIAQGHVHAAHDVSDGGLLVAVAEMLIGASHPGRSLGASLRLATVHDDPLSAAFSEEPSRYVLEVSPDTVALATAAAAAAGVPCVEVGTLDDSGVLRDEAARLSVIVGDMAAAWSAPLDW
jgi:phosphoribosylformylglycinamidine synthase